MVSVYIREKEERGRREKEGRERRERKRRKKERNRRRITKGSLKPGRYGIYVHTCKYQNFKLRKTCHISESGYGVIHCGTWHSA